MLKATGDGVYRVNAHLCCNLVAAEAAAVLKKLAAEMGELRRRGDGMRASNTPGASEKELAPNRWMAMRSSEQLLPGKLIPTGS